jgi:hypothetical protein
VYRVISRGQLPGRTVRQDAVQSSSIPPVFEVDVRFGRVRVIQGLARIPAAQSGGDVILQPIYWRRPGLDTR